MSDPEFEEHTVIWLQPWCLECERACENDHGRLWCQDDVWGECSECGQKSTEYELVS